ncbi:MAG: hypothetical protein EXQ79_06885 [Acidimicrobiia bacterium]|nr:hypothetical protein [Acidimicrobiia bacterium]
MAERHFRPLENLRTLAAHQARFVVIGGYAAVLHGTALVTFDADICPDPDPTNLKRLCAALKDMDARLRTSTDPDGVPFDCTASFLSRMSVLNLVTDNGPLDLSFRPAASDGYEDLAVNARDIDIGGFVIKVAALDDVIRSKEMVGRGKDTAALPHLYALRDELAARENPPSRRKRPKEKS